MSFTILYFCFLYIYWLIKLYVLSVQFCDTGSTYCIVCSPPNVRSPCVTLCLTPCTLTSPLSSGNHHAVSCVYGFCWFVLPVRPLVAFSFLSTYMAAVDLNWGVQ